METIIIDGVKYDFFDQKVLIEKRIPTVTQFQVCRNKNICTGFVYFALRNKKQFLNSALQSYQNYNQLVQAALQSADNRKSQFKINDEGEYLNDATIQRDFPELLNQTQYCSLIFVPQQIENKNFILTLLDRLNDGDYLLINRSRESILFLKINQDRFLLVDSHQPYHGQLSRENVYQYISLNDLYSGIVELGVPLSIGVNPPDSSNHVEEGSSQN